MKLKTVARAMHARGMIDTLWSSDCQNGRDAMYIAYNALIDEDRDVIDDIARYNEVDVKVTMEIWRFLASTNRLM